MSRSTESVRGPRRAGRHLVAALAALALGLLSAGVIAAPAQAASDVTGTLVDQNNDPVLGLEFILHDNSSSSDVHVTSDSTTGDFTVTGVTGPFFFIIGDNPVTGAYTDISGDSYENFGGGFYFIPGNEDVGDLVLHRYVAVSGTITNYVASMGTVDVYLYSDAGGSWGQTSYNDSSTDGTFTIKAPVTALNYTLYFIPRGPGAFLDAYLGGVFDDPSLGTRILSTPAVGQTGITMTLPAAALISGTVTTDGATPLEGIWVWTSNEPSETWYDETQTDVDGHYTLRARPGEEHIVVAEDWDNNVYVSMAYDRRSGCGCDFDPVVPTIANPAEDIDFDLIASSDAPTVLGLLVDSGGSDLLDGIDVRLFRASGIHWVLVDDVTSDSSGPPNFGFQLSALGHYRLQFVDGDGHILTVTDGEYGTLAGSADPIPFSPLPGCYADIGDVNESTVAYVLADPATPAGACAALDATSGGGSGGTGGSGSHHSHGGSGGKSSIVDVTPTPTPTPTPTATPRPSASPTPSATAPAEVPPASAPDLWWLLWVILGIVVIVVVAGVVYFVRRR